MAPKTQDFDLTIREFRITENVTWADYKVFLDEVKKVKGPDVYNQFLPSLPESFLIKALTSEAFDKLPVVGVSWRNARLYAQWLAVNVSNDESVVSYRLPALSEWYAARKHYKKRGKEFDRGYSDWTTTSYDESMMAYSSSLDYGYDALPTDPPSMKRKIAAGSNDRIATENIYDGYITHYQDSGYSHIGFRLIETDYPWGFQDNPDWCYNYYERVVELKAADKPFDTTMREGEKVISQGIGNYLEGSYRSYHDNGKLKSEGLMLENGRVGTWKVYNDKGKLVEERQYNDPITFERLKPKGRDAQIAELRGEEKYFPSLNDEGVLKYKYIQEREVKWATRYWIRIHASDNPVLFKRGRLLGALQDAIINERVTIYDTLTDQFTDTITAEEFKKRLKGTVQAFEIKEDYFFDVTRGCTESRIIAICPLVEDETAGEFRWKRLAWFYWPQIRKSLGKMYIPDPRNKMAEKAGFKSSVAPRERIVYETLDYLFFYRNFSWEFVKQSSVYDRGDQSKEVDQLEKRIERVEKEHDMWITYGADQ